MKASWCHSFHSKCVLSLSAEEEFSSAAAAAAVAERLAGTSGPASSNVVVMSAGRSRCTNEGSTLSKNASAASCPRSRRLLAILAASLGVTPSSFSRLPRPLPDSCDWETRYHRFRARQAAHVQVQPPKAPRSRQSKHWDPHKESVSEGCKHPLYPHRQSLIGTAPSCTIYRGTQQASQSQRQSPGGESYVGRHRLQIIQLPGSPCDGSRQFCLVFLPPDRRTDEHTGGYCLNPSSDHS